MDNYTHHIPPPCKADLKVVHADDDILVVDKPSGLLSVPGRFVKDCVLHRVAFDYPDATIVHRLDLDTSGLLVLGLSRHAVRDLNRQFRERHVRKVYEAIVWGVPDPGAGRIDLPLGPADQRPRHRVDREHGKEAITHYETINAWPDAAHLRLRPETGRSHQLRIHLAELGHPILGCDLYAFEAAFARLDRLALHAAGLSLAHPATGDLVWFESAAEFGFVASPQNEEGNDHG